MLDRPDNVNVYVLYADDDEDLKRELLNHLSSLQRNGSIDVWHQDLVPPGADREAVVSEYLSKAHIILLLISANFLSPDCYDRYERDLRQAYERQKRGEVKIVPVILRPCDWRADILLAQMNPLPRGGEAVGSSQQENRDRAFHEIAVELQGLAKALRQAWSRMMSVRPMPPAAAPAPPAAEPPAAESANGDGVQDTVAVELIGQLLELLASRRVEEGKRQFRDIAHISLFPGGDLDPSFEKNNFAPAYERARLYFQPPVILSQQPTGRTHLGNRVARQEGEEVKYSIARTDDMGGFSGQVRVFFPADGGPPRISGLSL